MPGPAGYVESNGPLELISPRAVNSAAPGAPPITAAHRIFKAYPGLEYDIRAVVTGGAYPYTFSLTNAPSGMTIDSATGRVRWTNPQANATPTLTVTDSVGAQVSSNWTIVVGAAGFKFVDAVNGSSTNQGTETSPWRTLADVSARGGAGSIVYFRAGTYTPAGIARTSVGTVWERVVFNANSAPVVWLAYPGERPVIDFGYQPTGDVGPLIRLGYAHPYVDGFETINSHVIGFQLEGGEYATFRRLHMHAHAGGPDGSNSSTIMTTTWDPGLYGMAVQDNEFDAFGLGNGLKIYGRRKLVIEDNHFHHQPGPMELKAGVAEFTVRSNRFNDISGIAIGGNMHSIGAAATGGDILFNLVLDSSLYALDLNQDGMATRINVLRNTFLGRVNIRNVTSGNGPFRLNNNVVINADGARTPPFFTYEQVSDPSRVIIGTNLTGTPSAGLVDANGQLTAASLSNLGTHGHQR